MFESPTEFDDFTTAILQLLVAEGPEGTNKFLIQVLGVHAGEIASAAPNQQMRSAVEFMVAKGFFYQPPLMEALLTELEARAMDCSLFRQRLKDSTPPIFHSDQRAWSAPLLPGNEPFFDRDDARRSLEDLLKSEPPVNPALPFGPKPPRVLAIVHPSHPRAQGRTQLYHYLRYRVSLQPWKQGLGLAYINFREHQTLRPEKFLSVLAQELGVSEAVPERGASLDNNWHGEVLEWLVQNCLQSHKWWYFVFDNFDDPAVPAPTLALIDYLTWYLTMEPEQRLFHFGRPLLSQQPPPMRLVLLGYDVQRFQELGRGNRIGNRLCQLSLPPIERQHLANCFKAILALRQVAQAEAEKNAEHVADSVMAAVEMAAPPQDKWLPLLNQATKRALLQLGWC